jgi:hypothetical protein
MSAVLVAADLVTPLSTYVSLHNTLQAFIAYGQLAMNQDNNIKVFQVLCMLVMYMYSVLARLFYRVGGRIGVLRFLHVTVPCTCNYY